MGLWKSNAGSDATSEYLLRLIKGKSNVAELEESLKHMSGKITHTVF